MFSRVDFCGKRRHFLVMLKTRTFGVMAFCNKKTLHCNALCVTNFNQIYSQKNYTVTIKCHKRPLLLRVTKKICNKAITSHTVTSLKSHTVTSLKSHTVTSLNSHTVTSLNSHTVTSLNSHTCTSLNQ